jgi:4-amino-4-deoxy-L-arabinose transferase-like glycosyltransferase
VIRRSLTPLQPLRPWLGVLLGLGAPAVLAGAIALEGGRDALWQWAYTNHVQRFINPVSTGHGQPIGYYLAALPQMLLPWLCPFLDLFRSRVRFWTADQSSAALKAFCGAMVVGGLAVLTAASSKRQIYLLPLLPPLFLLMAVAVEERLDSVMREGVRGRWLRIAVCIQILLCVAIAVGPGAACLIYTGEPLPGAVAALGLAIAVVGLAAWSAFRGNIVRSAKCTFAAVVVGWATALLIAAPLADAEKDLAPFVARFGELLPAAEPVYACGADETLLGIVPFVTNRRVVTVLPGDLDLSSRAAPPLFVVVQSKTAEQPCPGIERLYYVVEGRSFGPGRRISLWRLKAK